ncbi:response regulator [Coriobacteriia bacterium Es71-Z0120]|uniref:response regulator n=1 Tax=Parvivirga hydrogeniphila TaxID=2939460 RepID=UPI002260DF8F|nr:response regulator [Parvivirga hydrogeniphila]MCL4078323.1 response regulator [Parvivirga hydrogeniphila]
MKRKVLLVEDNPQNRYLLTFLLEKSGYEVVSAEDGEAAVEAVPVHSPDVILMDVQLPKIDGYEATRRIKSDERFASIPVLALTAHSMKGDRARALEAGCDDYITKPVDIDVLLRRIGEVIGQ